MPPGTGCSSCPAWKATLIMGLGSWGWAHGWWLMRLGSSFRQTPVTRCKIPSGLVPGEGPDAVAAPGDQLVARRVVGQHPLQDLGECLLVGRFDEQRRIAGHLGDRSRTRGDDRCADAHRFEDRKAES